jgi:hypothetical protein
VIGKDIPVHKSVKRLLLTAVVLAFLWYMVVPWIPISTALAYPLLRDQWRSDEILHFPRQHPDGAVTTGFYFNWGQLQSSKAMEWRLQYNKASFPEALRKLSGLAQTMNGK